jgi:hypothetical protein
MTTDKIVEEVLPRPCLDWTEISIAERVFCIASLKQAIEQGKLVVPLSLNHIMAIMVDFETGLSHQDLVRLGLLIEKAQFKERV